MHWQLAVHSKLCMTCSVTGYSEQKATEHQSVGWQLALVKEGDQREECWFYNLLSVMQFTPCVLNQTISHIIKGIVLILVCCCHAFCCLETRWSDSRHYSSWIYTSCILVYRVLFIQYRMFTQPAIQKFKRVKINNRTWKWRTVSVFSTEFTGQRAQISHAMAIISNIVIASAIHTLSLHVYLVSYYNKYLPKHFNLHQVLYSELWNSSRSNSC